MKSNKEKIEQLQRTVWNLLALLTGSSGEPQSDGLVRLRLVLARELGEKDAAYENLR